MFQPPNVSEVTKWLSFWSCARTSSDTLSGACMKCRMSFPSQNNGLQVSWIVVTCIQTIEQTRQLLTPVFIATIAEERNCIVDFTKSSYFTLYFCLQELLLLGFEMGHCGIVNGLIQRSQLFDSLTGSVIQFCIVEWERDLFSSQMIPSGISVSFLVPTRCMLTALRTGLKCKCPETISVIDQPRILRNTTC